MNRQLQEFKDSLDPTRYYKVDAKYFSYAMPQDMSESMIKTLYEESRIRGFKTILEESLPSDIILG